jgi:hypothetical protein
MNKVVMILILGLVLLHHLSHRPYEEKRKRAVKGPIEKQMAKIARKFRRNSVHKTQSKLIVAMVFGVKRGLPQTLKKKFQTLNLLHLFTPSGLHFSSLFIFLTPIFNRSYKWNKKLPKVFTILICLFPFFLIKFYSLKRIALLKILTILFNQNISIFKLFCFTFLYDFFLGSYEKSPLSFAYSFIFLGVLLSFNTFNWKIVLSLITAQMILAISMDQTINLAGSIFGFMITALFSLFFPLLIFTFSLFPLIGNLISEFLIGCFLQLINYSYLLSLPFPNLKVSLEIIFFILIILSNIRTILKKRILLLGLILL